MNVRPIEGPAPVAMPKEFDTRRLVKRALQIMAVLLAVLLIGLLAPGLGEVRRRLSEAQPGWIVLAIALEALSCLSYVLMFRPVFCRHMSRRSAWEIAWSELGVGSIVPASGAGGLALGAWVLRRGGMPAEKIARRSVAFFIIKSSVNFVAVVIVGTLMALGLFGPHLSPWLTAFPALGAAVTIAVVVLVPRLGPGDGPAENAGAVKRGLSATRRALIGGTTEAMRIVRSGEWPVIFGAIGYWAFDNATLWATFKAFGYSPNLAIILMGYLIGQLGGLLPLPGGLGGIDGGLIGTFVVYGTPVDVTVAAVLVYRVILFWLPLIVGAIAFWSLRKGLNDPERPDLCNVPEPAAAPA